MYLPRSRNDVRSRVPSTARIAGRWCRRQENPGGGWAEEAKWGEKEEVGGERAMFAHLIYVEDSADGVTDRDSGARSDFV